VRGRPWAERRATDAISAAVELLEAIEKELNNAHRMQLENLSKPRRYH
jgi:hypothetical protein